MGNRSRSSQPGLSLPTRPALIVVRHDVGGLVGTGGLVDGEVWR